MYKWEPQAEKLWNSGKIALILIICGICIAIWALSTHQSPGTSIGILGAATAVMSLRGKIRPLERAAWILIIAVLLVAEIESIRRNDEQVHADRVTQNKQFEALNSESRSIIDGLKDSIQVNHQQFQQTMNGINTTLQLTNSTLNSEQKTYEQTRPIAYASIDRIIYRAAPGQSVPIEMNVYYSNIGKATGRKIFVFGKIYVASIDQEIAEKLIEPDFERAWEDHKKNTIPGDLLAPHDPKFKTFLEAPYTPTELQEIQSGSSQIYSVVRIQFSDETGTWVSDTCDRFHAGLGNQEVKACKFLREPRYKLQQTNRSLHPLPK